MTKACQICLKGPRASFSRSHSNIKTKRRNEVNLQMKVIEGKRTRVCARCIKTIKKHAAEKLAA